MANRRHGAIDAFYGTAPSTLTTTGAPNAFSKKVNAGQDADQIVIYVQASGATTFNIFVAHSGGLTPSGNEPDAGSAPADNFFLPLYYTGTQMQITLAGAGTRALIIPDWCASWVALQSTATVNALAGLEISAA